VMHYNGAVGPTVSINVATPLRYWTSYPNNGSPSNLKVGSLSGAPTVSANPVNDQRNIGANNGALFAAAEIFAVIYAPPVPAPQLATFDTALNSAPGYGPGAIGV